MHHGRRSWQQERLIGKVVKGETRHRSAQQWVFNNSVCVVVDARRRHVTFGTLGHVFNRDSKAMRSIKARSVAQCIFDKQHKWFSGPQMAEKLRKSKQSKNYL